MRALNGMGCVEYRCAVAGAQNTTYEGGENETGRYTRNRATSDAYLMQGIDILCIRCRYI